MFFRATFDPADIRTNSITSAAQEGGPGGHLAQTITPHAVAKEPRAPDGSLPIFATDKAKALKARKNACGAKPPPGEAPLGRLLGGLGTRHQNAKERYSLKSAQREETSRSLGCERPIDAPEVGEL